MASAFQLSLGANYQGGGRTSFRVWAPDRRAVEVCLEGRGRHALGREPGGYFSGVAPAGPGARYRYRLDGGPSFPDPCSRWQPEGPHGPSEILEPSTFRWTDERWPGLSREGLVLYELHVGAFSPEGTYAGVAARLEELAALGVTCLELMPVNGCPGRFNWGYDGVSLFAPYTPYGSPDELRRLVNAAHRLGLGVILDVVYNHLGPDGNYLRQFAAAYFTDRYPAEWGEPINFEGDEAGPVRDFFVQNACYWVSEFHFDGLRLDATQSLHDASPRHIVAELAAAARQAASPRRLFIVAETEPQDERLLAPVERAGHGLDAIWVDDFHHSCRVAAGGAAEAYCRDYRGTAQELLSCALHGSLYQGQWYGWQRGRRGTPLLHVDRRRLVFYLQNHDQVANGLGGERLHLWAGTAMVRALTVLWLLLPQTPMLFMGQEYFASSPFLFFADHLPELSEAVRRGREEFLAQFPTLRHALEAEGYALPFGERAFRLSTLDWAERARPGHAAAWALHRELLGLRREDPTLAPGKHRLEGAVLSPGALVLRWLGEGERGDRLLLLNLGTHLVLEPLPNPLLAPPAGRSWRPLLSSEEIRFGGRGARFPSEETWRLPARSAILLTTREATP